MKDLWLDFKSRPLWRKALNIVSALFAVAGAAIIVATGILFNLLYGHSTTEARTMWDKLRAPGMRAPDDGSNP